MFVALKLYLFAVQILKNEKDGKKNKSLFMLLMTLIQFIIFHLFPLKCFCTNYFLSIIYYNFAFVAWWKMYEIQAIVSSSESK